MEKQNLNLLFRDAMAKLKGDVGPGYPYQLKQSRNTMIKYIR